MYSITTPDQLSILAERIMIILGILMCILGCIGNILSICVFTIWSRSQKSSNKFSHSNRSRNSSLYLLASSLANVIIIVYPLSTRILFDGYHYQITEKNVFVFCKFRYYVLHTFYLISLTSICMATLDRYFISSRDVHLRELNTTKQRTMFIIVLISCIIGLHNIPLAIYFNLSSNGRCAICSNVYSYYYLYVFRIALQGFLPILFLSIFGILTFKQLRTLTRHHSCNHLNSDKQLARMLLLISITIIVSTIPNCVEHICDIVFDHDHEDQSSRFFLYHVISSILFYTNPVGSFYIFYVSTPNFRHQLRNLMVHRNTADDFIHQQIQSKSEISNQERLKMTLGFETATS